MVKRFVVLFSSIFICFLSSAQELKNVLAEEITAEEYSIALAAMPEYNQTLDTLISSASKQLLFDLVASSLNDEEKYWLSWTDFAIFSIGQYPSKEFFALLWGPNYEDAIFVSPDKKNLSLRIKGSHEGVYSSTNIYAGYTVDDCDNRVIIRFYDTPVLGVKRLIALNRNDDMVYHYQRDMPSMVWYKGDLYCMWESQRHEDWGSVHYYKLHIER